MKRMIAVAAVAAVLGGLAAAAQASEGAVKYRQAVMKAVGGHMSAMGAILKGEGGEMSQFDDHAEAMADLARMSRGLFPAGSDMMASPDTRAKMEIWDRPAEFEKVRAAFVERAEALEDVAESGDKGRIAGALGALGKDGCKACHDEFREKKGG